MNYALTEQLKGEWERSKRYRSLSDWLAIFPEAENFLQNKLDRSKKERNNLRQRAKRAIRIAKDMPGSWFWKEVVKVFLVEDVRILSKTISNIRWALTPKSKKRSGKITREMIQRAKNYPIEDLFRKTHKKYWVQCPFHEDGHPSGYIKNNYFHCFGCGKQTDTIGILMDRDGATFKQAVKHLAR